MSEEIGKPEKNKLCEHQQTCKGYKAQGIVLTGDHEPFRKTMACIYALAICINPNGKHNAIINMVDA